MSELTMLIDTIRGVMLLEHSHLSADLLDKVTTIAGEGKEFGCARPRDVIPGPTTPDIQTEETRVRVVGHYHNSLVEGPGRRSSVLFQFCPLSCKGCWVPDLHSSGGGELVSIKTLAEKLLDPRSSVTGSAFSAESHLHNLKACWYLSKSFVALAASISFATAAIRWRR